MIPSPDAASSEMIRWTSTFAPMSIPRVGSSRIRTRGSVASHLARTTFCWLPPDRALDRLVDAGHPDVQPGRVAVADAPLPRLVDEQAREQPRQDRQRDVVGDREVEHQPFEVAVLRQVGHAGAPSPPTGSRTPRPCRRAGRRPRRAGRCRTAPGRPRSDRPRRGPAKPTISPARTEKLTSSKTPARVRPDDLEEDVADRALDPREQRDGPADHVPDEVRGGELGASAPEIDVPAVTQHRRLSRTARRPRRGDG